MLCLLWWSGSPYICSQMSISLLSGQSANSIAFLLNCCIPIAHVPCSCDVSLTHLSAFLCQSLINKNLHLGRYILQIACFWISFNSVYVFLFFSIGCLFLWLVQNPLGICICYLHSSLWWCSYVFPRQCLFMLTLLLLFLPYYIFT